MSKVALAGSTTTFIPPVDDCMSSSASSLSKNISYENPEQPPGRTATRRNNSGLPSSSRSSPTLAAAASVMTNVSIELEVEVVLTKPPAPTRSDDHRTGSQQVKAFDVMPGKGPYHVVVVQLPGPESPTTDAAGRPGPAPAEAPGAKAPVAQQPDGKAAITEAAITEA